MPEFNADEIREAFQYWRDYKNDYKIHADREDFHEWWYEACQGDVIDIPGIGEFRIAESVTGLNTGVTDEYNGDYTSWKNWIVIERDGRYFKLDGEDDSWDGQGWLGEVVEVEKVPVTVYEWEKKLEY